MYHKGWPIMAAGTSDGRGAYQFILAGSGGSGDGREVDSMMLGRRAAGMAAVLCALGWLSSSCAFGPPIPEGAEIIPADATFAVSVDVRAILESELYAKFRSDDRFFGRNRLNFFRFAEATGLDPSRDIQRLLFVARAGAEGISDMTGLVIGSFDGRKVHDYLVESGLDRREIDGMDIFEMVIVNDRCVFCLAVVDSSTAAFGSGEALEKIARVRAGSEPGLAAEARSGRLLRRLGRHPEAWGIVRSADLKEAIGEVIAGMTGNSSALGALGPIQEISFSFDTAEPLRILIELAASNNDDALLVADVLRGAESLGRLALGEARPEMGRMMADLSIEADTGIVRVAGSLTSGEIRAISGAFQGAFEGAMNPQDRDPVPAP